MNILNSASEYLAYAYIDTRAIWNAPFTWAPIVNQDIERIRGMWSCRCGLEGPHTKLQRAYPSGFDGPGHFQPLDT